jgi:large subunit ribosomal protein L24
MPDEGRVMVDGVGMAKRHTRTGAKRTRTGQQLNQGGIIDIETFVDISNVQLVCPNCHQLTRVGHKTTEDGKIRFCRKCEAVLAGG